MEQATQLLAVAEWAARRAGQVLLDMRADATIREKGPGDLVTSADLAAQDVIRRTIHDRFPTHRILGEEGSAEPDPHSEFRWIVDPLDGTSNYVHRFEFFAVSIAAEHRGELLAGVIFDPTAKRCFTAWRCGGAWLNGQPIRVSPVTELRQALLCTGFPARMRGRRDLLALFEEFCSESHAVRRLGSAALDLAYVAMGSFDGFYSTHLHAWDAAAGVLLVREAGGCVTRLDGSAYDVDTPDILASNGRVHDAMSQLAGRSLSRFATPAPSPR